MKKSNPYKKTIHRRQKVFKGKFLEVLREMPIIEYASKRTGIARATYYRWRNEDLVFAAESEESIQQGIDFVCEMGESQIIQLIKEKNLPAIKMWLSHNSFRYGAKLETQRIVYQKQSLLRDTRNNYRRMEDLTDEELDEIIAAAEN